MLTKDQIAKIRRSVKRRGLGSFSLEEELIDFISCSVESKLAETLSFEEAFRLAVLELEPDGVIPIQTISGIIRNRLQIQMLQTYFKIATRNLARHRANSFVNLAGLVLGLASVLVIVLYVQNELSYDDFHPDADRLYRVNTTAYFMDEPVTFSGTSLMLRQAILDEIPQVEAAVYKRSLSTNEPLKASDKFHYNYRFSCVQKEFFELFNFPVIEGNAEGFFNGPFNVLISSSFAARIFDMEDPVGQIISTERGGKTYRLTVVGVLADLPENTHLNNKWDGIDMISSMETYRSMYNYVLAWDINDMNDPTYVKLRAGADEKEVVNEINELLKRKVGEELNYEHDLQPIQDIYLNTRGSEIDSEGDMAQVYTFSLIGLLILAIACINYINLTTAKVAMRTKEVGVRKVLGARKRQFLVQFIVEAFLLSFAALILSLLVVGFLLPYANNVLDLNLQFTFFENTDLMIGLVLLLTLVSLMSGGFPGFYLSKFSSVNLLKSAITIRNSKISFRRILVVFQFGISAAIIVCTLVIVNQLNFIRNIELGFDKESVVYVALPHREMGEKANLLKDAFNKISEVKSASFTGFALGAGRAMAQHIQMGGEYDDSFQLTLPVDFDYANTMSMEMQTGRWFDQSLATDLDQGLVVNEAFVKYFKIENPIGFTMDRAEQPGTIIGVVKDFHFSSLYNDIEPLVMHMTRDYSWNYTNMALKLNAGKVENTMVQLEESWSTVFPNRPFEWSFLDTQLETLYRKEVVFGGIFKAFALIAIAVSCLGLLGLVSFSVERRSREIGIRKVLGASISNILSLVTKEFSKLVIVGFLISIPAAYFFLSGWLDDFKYHIDIGYSSFVWAGVLILAIAWLTISYISVRAAKSNPVDALKQE